MAGKLMLVAIVVATCGCVQNQIGDDLPVASMRDEQTPPASPGQADLIDDVLMSVLALPPIEVERSEAEPAAHVPATPGGLPIHTVMSYATDAEQYYLEFDPTSDMIYIEKHGGIADHLHSRLGPWSSSHPKVATLIRLVEAQQSQRH